jgi:hypothetical protein
MNPAAPKRGNRRGLRRAFWTALPAIPLAAWALANLWLASPYARLWIASKIQQKTGLEARIARASITPWNGNCLHQLEILQPGALRLTVGEPLARINRIRLTPIWRSWLRGKPEMRVVEIDTPQCVVPLELLAELAHSTEPASPTTPQIAANTPPANSPPTTPPAAVASTPASPEAPARPPPAPPAAPVLPPTIWLHLNNASFTVLASSSGKKWLTVSGVSGALPIFGRPAGSTLHIGSVQLAGRDALTNLRANLDWTSPLLSLKPVTTEAQGCTLVLAAKLAMLAGLPLQLEAIVPRQELKPIPLPADGQASAESITAQARFRGCLLSPATWQGELVAETQGASARISGHDAKFDHGSATLMLGGGRLSCLDARLIGDSLSLLGNATLLADGRIAAALRMVTAPEIATTLTQRAFPNISPPPVLTPLSTPQRVAFDLDLSGNFDHLALQLGKDGPMVELTRSRESPPTP